MRIAFVLATVLPTATALHALRASHFLEVLIGDKVCSADAYGAKGDGKTDDTKALQAALDDCGGSGGGQVVLPAATGKGVYLSTALNMTHDHTELNIPKGSTLLVSNDRKAWPGTANIIGAKNVQHVAITGEGTIDGQGEVWWENRNDFRPHAVQFNGVTFALIQGITLVNAPNHVLELYADHCEVAGVTIQNPPSTDVAKPSHNTDAVDVHGDPFYVHDCYFNTGDDNIAAHANNTLVENCRFGTGHGASIGSLCGDWLTNITFRNITFNGTTAGARIKVHEGCGGRVWNVVYEDLTMVDVQTPIDVTMLYSTALAPPSTPPAPALPAAGAGAGAGAAAGGGGGFTIDHVTFRNIVSTGQHYSGGDFFCSAGQPCRDIMLENLSFPGSDKGQWTCDGGKGCDCFTAATGFTVTGVTPDVSSCFSPTPPAPPTPPTPAPAKPTPAPPAGCDVDACFARCVAKYGGTIADQSYSCAKGCAGMSGQKVSDKNKFCKDDPADRYSKCESSCKSASSDPDKQAECTYGCGYWM